MIKGRQFKAVLFRLFLFFFLFALVVDDPDVFFRDQRDVVFFCPGNAAVEYRLQERTRNFDEILQSFISELDIGIAAVCRITDGTEIDFFRCRDRFGDRLGDEARELRVPEIGGITISVIDRNVREIVLVTPLTMAS